jgi:protein-glutamine gamma-glutamyltransferase
VHKASFRALTVSNAVMMFAGYLALTTTRAYPPQTLMIPLAICAMAPAFVWLDSRVKAYHLFKSFVRLSVVFFLFGMWIVRAAELIHIITWLVMYIQVDLMCQRKTVRYYYYLILMSFFLLIAACAQDPEPSFVFAFGIFFLSAVWALFMLHVYAESRANEGGSTPDIVDPSARGAIVPQRAGLRFDRNLYGSIGGLGFIGILLTVLLFLMTPRMEAGIFGANNAVQSTTDVTDDVDLNIGGEITADPTPVMRVRFPEEPNGSYGGPLYWRSTSLDHYRNGRWQRGSLQDNRYSDRTPFYGFSATHDNQTVYRGDTPGAERVHQEIYLDEGDMEGLPALPYPQTLTTSAGAVRWDKRLDCTVVVSNLDQSSLNYEVWSDVRAVDPEKLQGLPDSYPAVMGQTSFRVLTHHDLAPATVQLARRITEGDENAYDKVTAIRDHFLGGDFEYSLDVNESRQFRPVDDFVLRQRVGHCELFASAMALMVRSLGIPARVVSGYHGGEWNENDGVYLIRKNMAHLWVEVYFIGYGWVTFDPSPPSEPQELDTWERITRRADRYLLNAKMIWYRDIVGYTGGIEWARLRDALRDSAKLDFSFLSRDSESTFSVSRFIIPLVIVWLVAVGILGWAVYLLAAFVRRRAAMRQGGALTPDQVRARRLFGALKRRLSKLGSNCAGCTSREIIEKVDQDAVVDPGPVRNILETYNRVRFGGYPMDRAEFSRLQGVVRRVNRLP